MTKDDLIVKQQLELEELKESRDLANSARNEVHNIIYCIGGPLNDNKLGYTREQMVDFARIVDALNLR